MEILKLRSTITEMKISLEIKQYATKKKTMGKQLKQRGNFF